MLPGNSCRRLYEYSENVVSAVVDVEAIPLVYQPIDNFPGPFNRSGKWRALIRDLPRFLSFETMMRVFFHFYQEPLQVACPLQRLVAAPLAIGPGPVDVPLLFCLHPGGFGKIVLMNDGFVVPLRPDLEQVNRPFLVPPAKVQVFPDSLGRTIVGDVVIHHGFNLG